MDTKDSPHAYDVYVRNCPSHATLGVLATKWTHLVICALKDGTRRFGDLTRRIDGITPKMLTHTLRVLERDGLVMRRVYPVIPPRVDYALTELGRSVVSLLDAVLDWSQQHV